MCIVFHQNMKSTDRTQILAEKNTNMNDILVEELDFEAKEGL